MSEGVRLAYLVSRYPYVSHVFILREVQALRRAGAEIDTFTVRRPAPEEVLSHEDREAVETTFAIVPPEPAGLLAAHLRAALTRPGRYLSTLGRAWGLRGPGARATIWQLFYFGESVLMWHECVRRGIRHIHAHHANVASDVALLASHLGGEEWSWSFTMHGTTEFFDVREHRLPQKVELARFVRCVSEHGRSQLMTFVGTEHWDKLHVVHCGIDVRAFEPPDRAGRTGAPEVLTVGRLVPVKGQTLLIRSVAELARRGVDARLTIVGEGPQRDELEELATRLGVAARVELPGAVGQDSIRDWYARADFFALTSFAEGLPVVLLEAMAMGLPVVASHITGIPELVDDGVSGLLVTPGREDELTDALGRMAEVGAERRAGMGRAGRDKVAAEFDIDQTARQLLRIFESQVTA